MVVAILAAALVVLGAQALTRSHDLAHAVAVSQLRMVGPALVVVVAVLFCLERRWPAVRRPAKARAHVVDGAYLLLLAAVAPLVTLLDTGFAVEVERHASFLVLGRLPLCPQLVAVALTLLAIDAVNWAAHVANHRSGALWRFHALHHSQEEMSVFTTFRTHPLTHASYAPALVPALLLGATGPLPASALIGYGCMVTMTHANLPWTFGPVGKVLVSPAYHRLHHARAPVGGKAVVNFGFGLTCWDRLAGLAADPVPGLALPTGIGGRSVPVEQALPGRKVPTLMAYQLLQPFRPADAMAGRA